MTMKAKNHFLPKEVLIYFGKLRASFALYQKYCGTQCFKYQYRKEFAAVQKTAVPSRPMLFPVTYRKKNF